MFKWCKVQILWSSMSRFQSRSKMQQDVTRCDRSIGVRKSWRFDRRWRAWRRRDTAVPVGLKRARCHRGLPCVPFPSILSFALKNIKQQYPARLEKMTKTAKTIQNVICTIWINMINMWTGVTFSHSKIQEISGSEESSDHIDLLWFVNTGRRGRAQNKPGNKPPTCRLQVAVGYRMV